MSGSTVITPTTKPRLNAAGRSSSQHVSADDGTVDDRLADGDEQVAAAARRGAARPTVRMRRRRSGRRTGRRSRRSSAGRRRAGTASGCPVTTYVGAVPSASRDGVLADPRVEVVDEVADPSAERRGRASHVVALLERLGRDRRVLLSSSSESSRSCGEADHERRRARRARRAARRSTRQPARQHPRHERRRAGRSAGRRRCRRRPSRTCGGPARTRRRARTP